MDKVLIVIRAISFALFLIATLTVHSYMPAVVQVLVGDAGNATTLEKDSFFYLVLGVFMLVNVFLIVLVALLKKIPVTSGGLFKSDYFKGRLLNWLRSFEVVLNIFIVLAVAFIGIYNNPAHFNPNAFGWLIYFGFGLIGLWMLLLVGVFMKRA